MQIVFLVLVSYTNLSFYAMRKGPWYIYQNGNHIENEQRIVNSEFLIGCISPLVSICHIKSIGDEHIMWGLPWKCVMTYWVRIGHVWNWASCLLYFEHQRHGMKHHPWNLCTLFTTEIKWCQCYVCSSSFHLTWLPRVQYYGRQHAKVSHSSYTFSWSTASTLDGDNLYFI